LNWSKFQKDWDIPSSCLPSDFSGNLGSSTELHKAHCEMFTQHRDYFIADEEEAKIV
jgi:hypothetical protein